MGFCAIPPNRQILNNRNFQKHFVARATQKNPKWLKSIFLFSQIYLKQKLSEEIHSCLWGTDLFTKGKLCNFSLFVCLGSSQVGRGPCFFAWNNIGGQARALSLSIQTNIKKHAGNIIIGQLLFSLSLHKELLNVVSAHPIWTKCSWIRSEFVVVELSGAQVFTSF